MTQFVTSYKSAHTLKIKITHSNNSKVPYTLHNDKIIVLLAISKSKSFIKPYTISYYIIMITQLPIIHYGIIV